MSREGKEWGEAVQYRHVELTAGTDRRRSEMIGLNSSKCICKGSHEEYPRALQNE